MWKIFLPNRDEIFFGDQRGAYRRIYSEWGAGSREQGVLQTGQNSVFELNGAEGEGDGKWTPAVLQAVRAWEDRRKG